MKSFLQKQAYFTGFQPRILAKSLKKLPTYLRDMQRYEKMNNLSFFKFELSDAFPILTDMDAGAGIAGGHYFHQDLWAARKIFERRPVQHFDIGSRGDGFVAHLLVFMPVTAIDIRPMTSTIHGLTFLQDDAAELANLPDDGVPSLSTLHVAEHFDWDGIPIQSIPMHVSDLWLLCSEYWLQAEDSISPFPWAANAWSSMRIVCLRRKPFLPPSLNFSLFRFLLLGMTANFMKIEIQRIYPRAKWLAVCLNLPRRRPA